MGISERHYIVATIGSTGDLHPLLSIARALQALGRKVTFVTHVHFEDAVRRVGVPMVGLGSEAEYRRILDNPDLWNPRKALGAALADYGSGIRQFLGAIQSLAADGSPVVIAHPFVVPAAAIARELGSVQSVASVYLAPSNLRTCHDPLNIGDLAVPRWVPMSWRRALWRFVEKAWIDPVALPQVNRARRACGLVAVDSFMTHLAEAPDLSVTLFPAWFAPAMPDWPRPLVEDDFALFDTDPQSGFSAELSAFLAAEDKPLVFTPGTGNLHAARFFAVALAAVQRLGRRAIFLTRERAQIPARLPDSVLWQDYVPLAALLPQTACLVHHGGIGTTAEALRAGVPQLVTPFAWDQFDNAARVANLGAGISIPARRLRPGNLARAIRGLCEADAIRSCCSRIATRFESAHDPAALCQRIERSIKRAG